MNDIAINNVLAQMRTLRTQGAGFSTPAAGAQAINGSASANFSDALTSAIKGVNSTQNTANNLATRFELGDDKVDLSDVMMASTKAQVQFRGAVEVRNRLVAAYQDVMNMPI